MVKQRYQCKIPYKPNMLHLLHHIPGGSPSHISTGLCPYIPSLQPTQGDGGRQLFENGSEPLRRQRSRYSVLSLWVYPANEPNNEYYDVPRNLKWRMQPKREYYPQFDYFRQVTDFLISLWRAKLQFAVLCSADSYLRFLIRRPVCGRVFRKAS